MSPENSADDSNETVPRTDVHRVSVDQDRGVAMSVVEELAELRDCSATELDPIHYDIDTEKLDWIVEGAKENKVSFVTNGYAVIVYGDGTLVFTPVEE